MATRNSQRAPRRRAASTRQAPLAVLPPPRGMDRLLADGLLAQAQQQPRADTRHRILRGAVRVFKAKGYEPSSEEDLLLAAGVSRRTFYQNYSGKLDVLRGLFQAATGALQSELLAAMGRAPHTARGQIEAMTAAYLEIQRSGGTLLMLLQSEAVRPDTPLAADRAQALDALVEAMAARIEAVAQRPVNPLTLRYLMLGFEGLCVFLHQRDGISRNDVELMLADAYRVMATALALPLEDA